jgi:pimeloyl-ACP methyl ester carboxylesterase
MRCDLSGEAQPRVIEALLQSGSQATPYVRAGDGEVALLVRAVPCGEIARSRTFRRIAQRRRVIGAAPPPGAGVEWLRDLIDGLGLDRPEVMGDRGLAALLLGFAAAHPERVSRVTLLDEEAEAVA